MTNPLPVKTTGLAALVAVAAASLGIIYGYDTSNIGAAKDFIKAQYELGDGLTQAMATVVVVGEILGAVVGGWFANRVGRKKAMVTVGASYALFALFSAVAPTVSLLLVARFLLGLTVGVSVVVVPVFVAESAPAKSRGAMLVPTSSRRSWASSSAMSSASCSPTRARVHGAGCSASPRSRPSWSPWY